MQNESDNKALAEQIISKAIQEVVFRYNAYAPIISSFRIVYTNDVPTLGVDKYARLMINPDFVIKEQAHSMGLLIHETLHIFFGHTTNARDKLAYTDDAEHNKLVNIAEDCAINQLISESLPNGCVTPETLTNSVGRCPRRNESAEYYYDFIMQDMTEEERKELTNGGCSTDMANTSEMQDKLDKMSIEHVSQEEVNERVMDTAKGIAKDRGSRYGALARFAREMLEPKVDWRPLLQTTLRNAEKKVWTIHSKQTFKRTSRRSGQIIIPKRYGHKIAVSLSFDTSGSISSEMVSQFLAEIKECMRYSEIKECALWHTEVYWYGTPEELDKNVEKVFESGGTSETCMSVAERHCKADLHIHFSDGYHGTNYGFKEPHKNIEIIWHDNEINEIRKEF